MLIGNVLRVYGDPGYSLSEPKSGFHNPQDEDQQEYHWCLVFEYLSSGVSEKFLRGFDSQTWSQGEVRSLNMLSQPSFEIVKIVFIGQSVHNFFTNNKQNRLVSCFVGNWKEKQEEQLLGPPIYSTTIMGSYNPHSQTMIYKIWHAFFLSGWRCECTLISTILWEGLGKVLHQRVILAIFEWDESDFTLLMKVKRQELQLSRVPYPSDEAGYRWK